MTQHLLVFIKTFTTPHILSIYPTYPVRRDFDVKYKISIINIECPVLKTTTNYWREWCHWVVWFAYRMIGLVCDLMKGLIALPAHSFTAALWFMYILTPSRQLTLKVLFSYFYFSLVTSNLHNFWFSTFYYFPCNNVLS